jgi:hypothetical protein
MLCCSPKKSLSSYVAAAEAASVQASRMRLVCLRTPVPGSVPSLDLHTSLQPGLFLQKLVPSGGCGSFLLAGAAMYRRISMSTVSMVKSRFQFAMLGSLARSTCGRKWCVSTIVVFVLVDAPYRRTLPLLALTQGRLTLLMKVTSGGESGY